MSADDQAFLDILSSVPNDIKRYSSEVADYVDRHLEHASNVLREALSSSSWIPEPVRPRRPPPPKTFIESASVKSTYAQIHSWVMKHKVWATVIILVAGGVTYHVIRRKSNRKKRRAKRAGNGARLEVVVIAGSPSEPLTRSISLDLERRGFIVYIVCNTIEEEILVQNESRPDIKPLMIDIVDPSSARASIDRFTAHLQTPHAAFPGARAHHLTLRSLVLIPSTTYPSSPIAALPPSTLADLLNTRVLTPILTLQTFLPLLTSSPLPHLEHNPSSHPPAPKPSVLLLTPTIIPSLSPAFHLSESSITAALTSFSSVLYSELSPLSIPVTHIQLGNFDLSAFTPHTKLPSLQAQRAETLHWDESARQAFARNFVAASSLPGGFGAAGGKTGRGSSLRELNNAVFDAMTRGKGGIVRVGMGSWVYGFVGRWVPSGLVGWMMGIRSVQSMDDAHTRRGIEWRLLGAAEGSSGLSTPGSGSAYERGGLRNFEGVGERLGESSFVAVSGGSGADDSTDYIGL